MATRPVLISGCRLFDAVSGRSRAAAIGFDDRVRVVGDAAESWAEATGAARVDGTGATVMPGLIDAHCHISFDEPHSNDELFFHRREGLAAIVAAHNVRKLLRAGVTGCLDADTIFAVSLDVRDAIEAGLVEGPRLACGGNALFTSVGGTAGLLVPDEGAIGYLRVTRTTDEIVTEVRRQAKRGVDWIKVHVTGLIPRQRHEGEIQVWSADELRTVVMAAHDLGLPVVGHCRNASSTRDAARAGFDMILHATHMDEEALDAVVAARVPLVPTLTFQAVLADHGDRVGASPVLRDIFRREIAASSVQLKRAFDAGVPLLCGTESGFSITPYGEWHWRELQVMVDDIGLTPAEALIAATREGARAVRLEGEVGTLAPGQLADLLLVDGDPTADVTLLGRPGAILGVWKGGEAVDLASPLPERRPIPDWRVQTYSSVVATRAAVARPGAEPGA